jgi:solute carrier family 25 2-oxodicarboxylate transporter 21
MEARRRAYVTCATPLPAPRAAKVRMMAREHNGRYATSVDCLRKVLGQEGPAALLVGMSPTLWRNCVWNSIYYGTTFELER